MKRLAAWVHVPDETGETHVFGPDDVVPAWAAEKITNPKAWAADDVVVPVAEVAPPAAATGTPAHSAPLEPPPKGGPGSGHEAWAKYAEQLGVDIPEGANRDDIIAAVEAA